MSTVLVTGGSGFVAGHLIAQLLERGDDVHATVRSLHNRSKVAPLDALTGPGSLTLFEADLLQPGSFDEAAAGCEIVYHVASPFKFPEHIEDGEREMVRPAVEGVRNVLASVDATPTVKRVVLTSTVGAIYGDYIDVLEMDNQTLTEKYFNTTSTVENNPYHYSKVRAEKEAWAINEKQDRWDLVVICPSLVVGPSLSPGSESGSLALLDELMGGEFFYGAANINFSTVDVREVAYAHVRAAEVPEASGRYIVSHSRMNSLLEIARMIRPVHARPYLLPRFQLPNIALTRWIGARYGLTPEFIEKHVGIAFAVDNHRSIEELGVSYRPIQDSLRDHYGSWAAKKGWK
jgi:nucleoside-diphosphate-sugar epimerase